MQVWYNYYRDTGKQKPLWYDETFDFTPRRGHLLRDGVLLNSMYLDNRHDNLPHTVLIDYTAGESISGDKPEQSTTLCGIMKTSENRSES